MQNVLVARVIVDPSIVAKLQSRHNPLTAGDVREALVHGRYSSSGWDDDEEHGLRLVVKLADLVRMLRSHCSHSRGYRGSRSTSRSRDPQSGQRPAGL